LLFVAFVIGIGIFGYSSIEGWGYLDSAYMTIITLTTTGYQEVHDLSDNGRIFTMFFLVIGLATYALILSIIIREIVEFEFNQFFWSKKMKRDIEKMSDHSIICGFGKMGKSISEQLADHHEKFVVIEQDKHAEGELKRLGYNYFIDDATDDEVLEKAGVRKAKNLISVVNSDSGNVFIALSVRSLNKDLFVISRAYNDASIEKLKKAGANKVISPYSLMSTKITQTILNPAVNDFLEIISEDATVDFQLAEIGVDATFKCTNKRLIETDFKDKGIIIVGIKKASGKIIFAPTSQEIINDGDKLIALGSGQEFSDILKAEIS